MGMIRMATDVGGTFTDIVWVDDNTGEVKADKAPTTPRDVVEGVLEATRKTAVPASANRAVCPWLNRGHQCPDRDGGRGVWLDHHQRV